MPKTRTVKEKSPTAKNSYNGMLPLPAMLLPVIKTSNLPGRCTTFVMKKTFPLVG